MNVCIVRTDKPFVVNQLSVNMNWEGKQRLNLDLIHVNEGLHKFLVRFEGLEQLVKYIEFNGLLAKFDLKSVYHHIVVFPEH